jgi:hypothetical protein
MRVDGTSSDQANEEHLDASARFLLRDQPRGHDARVVEHDEAIFRQQLRELTDAVVLGRILRT